MTPKKLKVYFAFFSYGGNGGVAMEHPSLRGWFARLCVTAKRDERIGEIEYKDYCDTPITMTRNDAIEDAKASRADVLVMVDSDQFPDLYVGKDPLAKPFFPSSFDALYAHHDRGPLCIVAPYCGPPPHEAVYVFRWRNWQGDHPNVDMKLDMYTREEAAVMGGLQECAAGPTGLIMFDIRCFDLKPPPYCYYEWTDQFERRKSSTEDVALTRDIAVFGQIRLGYNPMRCNWDAWAGHMKCKCVGKPEIMTQANVGKAFAEATLRPFQHGDRVLEVSSDGAQPAADAPVIVMPGPAQDWTSRLERQFVDGKRRVAPPAIDDLALAQGLTPERAAA